MKSKLIMHSQTALPLLADTNRSNEIKLTALDRWYLNLIPTKIQVLMPHWGITAVVFSILAVLSGAEILVTMTAFFWASLLFALGFRKLKKLSPNLAEHKWIIIFYHALLSVFILRPVMAQSTVGTVSTCNTGGLFGNVSNFVVNVFADVTFGSVGGATLSNLICQVIAYITLTILLAFLVVAGFVSYQIGYNNQPISTAANPLMSFLVFAGVSSLIIGVMIGDGGTTGGGGTPVP